MVRGLIYMKFNDHFLGWIIIYTLLIYLVSFLLIIFNIQNYFFILLFAGFILSLGSWIFYSITYKHSFKLNIWILIWTFTNALSYWLISLFLGLFTIQIQIIYYLLFGCIFHSLTWFIKYKIYGKFKFRHKKSGKIILIFLILILVMSFVSSISNDLPNYNNQIVDKNVSIMEKLKSSFNFPNSFSEFNLIYNDCPQLDIPIFESRYQGGIIRNMKIIPLKDINFEPIDIKNYNNSDKYFPRAWANFQVDNDLLNYFLKEDICNCEVNEYVENKIDCPLGEGESEKFIHNLEVYSSYYKERSDRQDYSDPMKGWQISVLTPASIIGFEDDTVRCRKGYEEGENLNYYYCKEGLTGGLPYIIKKPIQKDGTLGKTTRKAFYNVYDINKKFIKTVCLGDPIKILDKEADEIIDNLIS